MLAWGNEQPPSNEILRASSDFDATSPLMWPAAVTKLDVDRVSFGDEMVSAAHHVRLQATRIVLACQPHAPHWQHLVHRRAGFTLTAYNP